MVETRSSKKRKLASCESAAEVDESDVTTETIEPPEVDGSDVTAETIEPPEARSPQKQLPITQFLTSPFRDSAAIKPSPKPRIRKRGKKGKARKAKNTTATFADQWGEDAFAPLPVSSPSRLPVVLESRIPVLRPTAERDWTSAGQQAPEIELATDMPAECEASALGKSPICGHEERCAKRTVRKNNANSGREFFTCARVVPCGTFYWADKLASSGRSSNRTSSPSSG